VLLLFLIANLGNVFIVLERETLRVLQTDEKKTRACDVSPCGSHFYESKVCEIEDGPVCRPYINIEKMKKNT
jgi:hypothetical protein